MQHEWQNILELFEQYKDAKVAYWINENLFAVNWWILFVTTVGLIIVWIILLDKKRIFEIMTYGFLVTVIAVMSDTIGLWFLLWKYPYSLLPFPQIVEIHTLQMPMIYMLIYQYFNRWKAFVLAATINALVFAFILEPLLSWLGIYELYRWKYIYSVIPYIAIAIVLKWLLQQLKKISIKS